MFDPYEGITDEGTIRTGARRDRVSTVFEPVLREAIGSLGDQTEASLYVYGSVATGTARPGRSDVDLLSIGLANAAELAASLSDLFKGRCRAVDIAATDLSDFDGPGDEAYGNRAFLRHYCVHLAGPDWATGMAPFPADVRAARGFNGDLELHVGRWRAALDLSSPPAPVLGKRIARKTLLAVAGMVSVHDHIWTTDRTFAARRWSEIEPELAPGLALLDAWVREEREARLGEVEQFLGDSGLVLAIVERFKTFVGLWRSENGRIYS